ncbi:MAG TPA: hypothetical protein VGI43_04675 [Mucilaginibacter sp.]|jgi:hypothetical protein
MNFITVNAFKISAVIFLCLVAFLNKIYAQKDYIVTKNHDTVFCKIKTDSYGEYSLAYKYKVNKNDDFVKIDSNVIAYHLAKDSAIYLLKNIQGFTFRTYLKRFVSGRINLYAYAHDESSSLNMRGNSETYLFAEKGENGVVQIKHTYLAILGNADSEKDEKAFLDLIADSPKLLEEFKKKSNNFYYILKYVKAYNAEYTENNKQVK